MYMKLISIYQNMEYAPKSSAKIRKKSPENANIHAQGGKKYSARFMLKTLIYLAMIRHKTGLIHQLQYEKFPTIFR